VRAAVHHPVLNRALATHTGLLPDDQGVGWRPRSFEEAMRTTRITTALLTLVLTLVLDAGTARALQLVGNFGFDTGIAGWSTCCNGTGTETWDGSLDHFGSALSGAVKLTHTAALPSGSLVLSTCLSGPDVAPGTQLFFGMHVRFAPGESTTGQAAVAVDFRTGPSCGGSSLSGASSATNAASVVRGTWVAVKRNPGSAAMVPAGAQSVSFSVTLVKSSAGTLTADFDDVYVAPVGTPLCDGLPATQVGGPDPDFLNGTDQSDVIVGKGDIDWIDGHGGNDHLCGGPGDDVLYGGPGDDRLFGEGGKDTLQGAADDDLLNGGGNNDTLEGGTGNDVLRGGSGTDTCSDEIDGSTVFRKCEIVPSAG
jgi:Ca2+-binding RTX toxin-like protein